MDIEFIENQHRENVLKLMQICGMDMKEAYQLYTQCGYNFEAAVNTKFSAIQEPQRPIDPYPVPAQGNMEYVPHIPEENVGPQHYGMDSFFDEDDIQMTEYRKFKQNGKTFDRKYPVRSNQGFFKSFIPKFLKGEEETSFKKDLQKYLGKHVNLKVEHANLSQAFNWCWQQKFPLCVIILDFKPDSQAAAKKLFSDDLLIQKVISEQYKAIGINAQNYDVQAQLKPFFDMHRDANSIVICRVNHLDNIEIVKRMNIYEGLDDIKKKIKQSKSECIQNQLDQSHITKQYVEELRGNFNYQRPRTMKENIKAREDKRLRKQQEEDYFKACRPKQPEKQERTEVKPQQYNNNRSPPERKQEYKPEIKPQQPVAPKAPAVSEEKIKQMRAEKLAKLRGFNTGVMFKIRIPEGRNIIVQVHEQEKIQYLFDFIENQPDDLGFSNQLDRKFDIAIGFGGTQTLKGKENKKIKDFFEGSEVLIVKELE